MTTDFTENYQHYAGVVRLIVTKSIWRYAFQLSNMQLSHQRFKGHISVKQLEGIASTSDILWLISNSSTLVLQFEDLPVYDEYGVYRIKMIDSETTLHALVMEFQLTNNTESFTSILE